MDLRTACGKFRQDERGVVVVYMALFMVIIFASAALAIDVGNLVFNKGNLRKCADAAALAGIHELAKGSGQAATEDVIRAYFGSNGGTAGEITATAVSVSDRKVEITAKRQVPFYFAPVIGVDSGSVSVKAVAKGVPVSGLKRVVPLAVEDKTFEYGVSYILKQGGGSGTTGNYGAIALGGRGASVYEKNFKEGYDGTLWVGDTIDTEPGNMSGPTEDGVNYRIGLCKDGCTKDRYKPDCPRIIYLPIIDKFENGRDRVKILGFAAFFLKGVRGNGNHSIVEGYFIKKVTQGETGGGGDYGLWAVKLVE